MQPSFLLNVPLIFWTFDVSFFENVLRLNAYMPVDRLSLLLLLLSRLERHSMALSVGLYATVQQHAMTCWWCCFCYEAMFLNFTRLTQKLAAAKDFNAIKI